MKHILGFIFDLDGTLVTSDLDFPAIKTEIGCPLEQDALAYIANLPTVADRTKAMDIIHYHELRDAQSCQWMPGAEKFVRTCIEHNMPMSIVTRNSLRSSNVKIEKNAIPIHLLFTRENSKPKPDAEALLNSAKQFKLPPSNIVMVGDYKYDLQAGRNAAMNTCLVNFTDVPEYAALADYAFRNFNEFHRALFQPG